MDTNIKNRVTRFLYVGVSFLIGAGSFIPKLASAQYMTASDVVSWEYPPADARVAYGPDSLEFGDLRLPKGPGPHPVAVIIHGGCWLAQYDIQHIGQFARAVTELDIATWTLEYRRVGNPGAGWPGTFNNIADGADHLRELAKDYPLDLDRVIVIGHSAGGHFALWLAGRHRLPEGSPLYTADPISVRGVLGLAAVTDLRLRHREGVCGNVIDKLMGGSPAGVPDRYRQGSPVEMIPIGIPQILVIGAHDRPFRIEDNETYVRKAEVANEQIQLLKAEESGHFEVIAADSSTWPLVKEAILSFLKPIENH